MIPATPTKRLLVFAALAIPFVWGMTSIRNRALVAGTRAKMTRVRRAIDGYARDHGGRHPAALAELARPEGKRTPYADERDLSDPWGRAWVYAIDPEDPVGSPPRLASLGADGEPGGWGEDADVESKSAHAPR